jgi:hypothetical protein
MINQIIRIILITVQKKYKQKQVKVFIQRQTRNRKVLNLNKISYYLTSKKLLNKNVKKRK